MRVFAYCAKSFEAVTRQAAGVQPLTCPPLDAKKFEPSLLEHYDLLYFDMHGLPGLDYWFSEVEGNYGMITRIIALTAEQVAKANLNNAIVFATNCYLADEDSPMLDAFLDAGVQYVIGGAGKNWARTTVVSGASALGRLFRIGLEWGYSALDSLAWAKHALPNTAVSSDEVDDTLAFRAYYRQIEGDHGTYA